LSGHSCFFNKTGNVLGFSHDKLAKDHAMEMPL